MLSAEFPDGHSKEDIRIILIILSRLCPMRINDLQIALSNPPPEIKSSLPLGMHRLSGAGVLQVIHFSRLLDCLFV